MLFFIVPFRCTDQPERIYQLQIFVHTMQSFFPEIRILIMDQNDQGPFNRGFLLNAGAKISHAEDDDVLCFHNLTSLPSPDCLRCYTHPLPPKTVRHLREKGSHDKLGNIIFMRYIDFVNINGYPNDFFGCGGEDEELHIRILRAGLRLERIEGTLLSLKQIHPPSPKSAKNYTKWERLDWHKQHPGQQGLSSLCDDICSLKCSDHNARRYSVKIAYRIPPI